MKFDKWLILFTFILLIINNICAQCYEDFSYKIKPDIPNEPYFWFTQNVEFSFIKEGQIILKVDTSYFSIINTNPEKLSNQNFSIFSTDSLFVDSTLKQKTVIKNLSTQISYPIGLGDERFSIDLKNCYIYFFVQANNKRKISVFDYKNSSVTFYEIDAREPIGYNDTCIYLTPNNLKLGRVKYRSGTIISLNENGVKIVKPVLKKNNSYDRKCIFYSNSYSVHKFFLYKVERNCNNEYYYSIKINYYNKQIDSFVVPQRAFSEPYIKVKGDTLICQSNDDAFRKYFTTKSITTWFQSRWVDSLLILKNNPTNFFNKGDFLFLKVTCSNENKNGLISKDGNIFTLNEIPLKPECTVYSLVLAFDIKNNKFLGYPKIIFITKE